MQMHSVVYRGIDSNLKVKKDKKGVELKYLRTVRPRTSKGITAYDLFFANLIIKRNLRNSTAMDLQRFSTYLKPKYIIY